jgi:hypothetical protein
MKIVSDMIFVSALFTGKAQAEPPIPSIPSPSPLERAQELLTDKSSDALQALSSCLSSRADSTAYHALGAGARIKRPCIIEAKRAAARETSSNPETAQGRATAWEKNF